MRPTVLKLLHQEPVSRNEWQDLFWYGVTFLLFHVFFLEMDVVVIVLVLVSAL